MKKVITKGSKGKAPVISRKDRVYVGLDVHKRSIYAAVRINGVEHSGNFQADATFAVGNLV